jgi:hypothetical protein
MPMLVGFVLAAISVPLARGDLRRLSTISFRYPGLLFLALACQILVSAIVTNKDIGAAVHVASYVFVFAFIALNLRVPGLWLVGLGAVLNFTAIATNGGVMPADPAALERAGISPDDETFVISSPVDDPNLLALGDRFNFPDWFPASNPFSIGDVLIVAGAGVGMHTASGSRLVPRRKKVQRTP